MKKWERHRNTTKTKVATPLDNIAFLIVLYCFLIFVVIFFLLEERGVLPYTSN